MMIYWWSVCHQKRCLIWFQPARLHMNKGLWLSGIGHWKWLQYCRQFYQPHSGIRTLTVKQPGNSMVSLLRGHNILDYMSCQDLERWTTKMSVMNGRSILVSGWALILEISASLLGCGAVTGIIHIGGIWSPEKHLMHINVLELTVAVHHTSLCEGQNWYSHASEDGQSNSCMLHQSHGGNSFLLVEQSSYGSGNWITASLCQQSIY